MAKRKVSREPGDGGLQESLDEAEASRSFACSGDR
jgi:hypothetical protein